jgi:hypothetical protein
MIWQTPVVTCRPPYAPAACVVHLRLNQATIQTITQLIVVLQPQLTAALSSPLATEAHHFEHETAIEATSPINLMESRSSLQSYRHTLVPYEHSLHRRRVLDTKGSLTSICQGESSLVAATLLYPLCIRFGSRSFRYCRCRSFLHNHQCGRLLQQRPTLKSPIT